MPRPDQFPEDAPQRAYLAGIEGIPWRSENYLKDSLLTIDRDLDESGNLFIQCLIPGRRPVVLSTASLMERDQPYLLPVELARGTLNRLRQQAYLMGSAGHVLSGPYRQAADEAMRRFILAATNPRDQDLAARAAWEAIELALRALDELMRAHCREAIERRHKRETRLPTMMAVNVGVSELSQMETQGVLGAFNSAAIPVVWKKLEPNTGEFDWNWLDAQIEWCRGVGLRVCGGPILRLDKASLPDWIYLWEDDFEQLEVCVTSFVEATVARYRGKMHAWHCLARLNTMTALALSEEETVRLAVSALDAVRRVDSKTPLIVSFDQPWAEYLAREDRELSPLHFADALVRAELGIAGLGVEINLTYWPGGTMSRDLLELSQQIDRWLSFGLPLLVMLTLPSSPTHDPRAACQIWPLMEDEADSHAAEHATWVDDITRLLLAKAGVHGVIWNQLSDANAHEFAHGGLFDAQQQPKPAIARLTELRKRHLL